MTDAVSVCDKGSEVCCRCLCAGLAPTFPRYRPVPLLPERHPVAGTNLFGVLEKTRRSGDDPTCLSVEEAKHDGVFVMKGIKIDNCLLAGSLNNKPSSGSSYRS